MTKHHLLNSVELNKCGASYFLKEKNTDSTALSSIIKTSAISMPKPNTRVTKVQFTKLVI